MTETVKNFISRVDRLEARYAKDKYATTFQMPRDEMIALRDELRETARLEAEHDALLKNLQPISLASDGGDMEKL